MKKLTAIVLIAVYLIVAAGLVTPLYAVDTVVDNIESVNAAIDLAAQAEGRYVEGATAPALQGNEVALPVQDASGNILGHIVADRDKLISVLNAAGMTEVASALGAATTGTAAGSTATAGVLGGTTGKVVLGIALVAGAAAAIASGGSDSTTNH